MNKYSFSSQLYHAMLSHRNLIAISYKGSSVRYSEVLAYSLSFAFLIKDQRIKKQTIGVICDRNPATFIGLLGIVFSGCTYVPLSLRYNEKRLKAIIADTKLSYVVGSKSDNISLLTSLDRLGLSDIKTIDIPDYLSSDMVVGLNKEWAEWDVTQDLFSSSSLEDFIYIMYTSGSSGIPKGVGVTGINLMTFLGNMKTIYPLAPEFRASQTFDLTFDPSVSDMFFTWMNGGVLCILPDEDLLMPHEYILREQITFWNSVPTIGIFLYKMGLLKDGIFPSLTHSMFCGEQFPTYLANAWQKSAPNSSIENLYGPTEATIYISRYVYSSKNLSDKNRNAVIPIGSAFPGHEIALIDSAGERVSGVEGEIVFKGKQVTNGYLNDEGKTQSNFVYFDWDQLGEKWYRSGDLGFYNDEGVLECKGRIDSQIKIAGRRVEVGEIEAALQETGIISNAVVVPISGDNNLVTGCVAYITENLSNDDLVRLKNSCLKFLDAIFVPKKFLQISEFPLTISGKIDRKRLEFLANKLK